MHGPLKAFKAHFFGGSLPQPLFLSPLSTSTEKPLHPSNAKAAGSARCCTRAQAKRRQSQACLMLSTVSPPLRPPRPHSLRLLDDVPGEVAGLVVVRGHGRNLLLSGVGGTGGGRERERENER